MKRTSSIAEKLLEFEGNQAYLRCESAKLRVYVSSGPDSAMILGNKIPIDIGNRVIIAWATKEFTGVSASVYRGFGIFDEMYYENHIVNDTEKTPRFSGIQYRNALQSANMAVCG